MTITLNADYDVALSTALLGYVGETNARPVTVEGMEVDGADRYVLTIDYGDGTVYDVDISNGTWTPTADILRVARNVSCQISARRYDNGAYTLVKKSKIFSLRIGQALTDGVAPIPSPSVAADALDRMTALGDRITADVQTAKSAAETATTAADNAAKSATNAGVSADTATQAASRAETAQTVAETSATQAETAMQGADTARQQAVAAQNNAKISADIAAAAAQQTTADKTITAGYAETAKTAADSAAADRQAVQKMATQVTADKATVADNAAQVATDRKAAETAAQTAQAVADSLPDDYVAAVAKIAENTAEIGRVKLTDKELQRRVDALYDIGQGITHRFETDSSTAYAKTVPTGGKLMSVKNIGGRSIVWNQLIKQRSSETTAKGVKFTFSNDGIVTLNGTATATDHAVAVQSVNQKGHKYLMVANPLSGVYGTNQLIFSSQTYGQDSTGHGSIIVNESNNAVWFYTLFVYNGVTYDNVKLQPQIFDLTTMFGSGNEPASVEEFGKMFPADYYPYTAGKIVSAGVESVAVGDTAYPIPEAIKALPGYGWSAGTAKNYVDYENKRYVQCVNSVDLGTLTWARQTNQQRFYAITDSITGKLSESFEIVPNIAVAKYDTVHFKDIMTKIDNMKVSAVKTTNDYITIRNTAYTDATAFKQAMQGVMLYYELANPIITDISTLIPDDFLRDLTVEAGGSITFKNSNGDSYRIPVSSEEEYIVKLSEVGGTT